MLLFTKTSPQPSRRERQLESEIRGLKGLVAALTERLEDAQRASEGHYRAQYDATGGPCFDPGRPFGSEPKRPLGTLWPKGGAS